MVRSVLENGTEAVPDSVWESVSHRMEGVANGRKSRGVLASLFSALTGTLRQHPRTAAVSAFALVCAVAAVIVLHPSGGTFSVSRSESPVLAEGNAPVAEGNALLAEGNALLAEGNAPAVEGNAPEPLKGEKGEFTVKAADAAGKEPASGKVPSIGAGPVVGKVPPVGENSSEVAAVSELDADEVNAAAENTSLVREVPSVAGGDMSEERLLADSGTFDFSEDGDNDVLRGSVMLTAHAFAGENVGSRSSHARRAGASQMNFGTDESITETETVSFNMPVRVGMGVKFYVFPRVAVGLGLEYTWLGRRFKGSYDSGTIEKYDCNNIVNNQHFIGIPVLAYYDFVSGDKLNFYATCGFAIEKCISNSYSFSYYGYGKTVRNTVNGVQWRVNAGIGLQYSFTDKFGIYLDPEIGYYFRNYQQPKSIRTVQPIQISCRIGLRYTL